MLQKIQAIYFKIQGTYFKIYALYFSQKLASDFQQLTKTLKNARKVSFSSHAETENLFIPRPMRQAFHEILHTTLKRALLVLHLRGISIGFSYADFTF